MKKTLTEFLSDYPLYKSYLLVDGYNPTSESFTSPYSFHNESFNHYCSLEDRDTTFEILLPKESYEYWAQKPGIQIPDEVYDENRNINFIHHFKGVCRSCKNNEVAFLLHVWSDNTIPPRFSLNEVIKNRDTEKKDSKIYVEKVGAYPQKQIEIDSTFNKYFDRESQNLYYKAVKSYNESLGIGAFSYYRRILEKELKRIFDDVAKLKSTNHKLKNHIEKYQNTKKAYLIYENIYDLLPKSLQSLGENPFKLLYKFTSEGLHSTPDRECLKKAGEINMILKFIIEKINEENSQLLKIREAIKKLKD